MNLKRIWMKPLAWSAAMCLWTRAGAGARAGSVEETNAPPAETRPASAEEALSAETQAGRASVSLAKVQEKDGSPGVLDFAAFGIIAERNIFNPNRSARRARESSAPRRPQVKVETFQLVGTMSYDQAELAFFEGSSSSLSKAVKLQDAIAGYKVVSVSQQGVKLEKDDQAIELRVGAKMRREEDGPWKLTEAASIGSSSSGSSSDASADGDSEAGSDGAESEILKRLKNRRGEE